MKSIRKMILVPLVFLVGCVSNAPLSMQIMQKDTGKVYYAVWKGRSSSSGGFIEIDLEGKKYRGEPAKVDASNLFGLRSRFGTSNRLSSDTSFFTSYYRALLVNDDGVGMRCDFYLDFSNGSGLCMDASQKAYEITVIQ